MNIVSATALVVGESWEQFAIAACWIGGIVQTQVTALTAMMVRFLCVEHSTAADLVEIQLHPHVKIFNIDSDTNGNKLPGCIVRNSDV